MEDLPNVGSKEQTDVAKFAVVNGVGKTSEKFTVKPEVLKAWIVSLVAEELPLFSRLKDQIVEIARKKGVEGAARHFGVSNDIVDRLVNERALSDGHAFEVTYTCKSLQTSEDLADMRKVTSIGVQVGNTSTSQDGEDDEEDEAVDQPTKFLKDNEERKVSKKYSTGDKVNAVREFVKHSNQSSAAKELSIPTVSLNRWREKIKSSAFQDPHSDNLYGNDPKLHKDKFFIDLDVALNEWYQQNKGEVEDVDDALKRKAKSLAKVDDSEPLISEKWLELFKAHYHIGSEAPAQDDILDSS